MRSFIVELANARTPLDGLMPIFYERPTESSQQRKMVDYCCQRHRKHQRRITCENGILLFVSCGVSMISGAPLLLPRLL